MDCRVSLAQIDPQLGNLKANLALHLAEVEAARGRGADLVIFPEQSLTGYFLKDQTPDAARRLDCAELAALAERSHDITIGVGFVERARDGRLYNSYALLENGALLGVHRKVHLVTYGMFEESRDVDEGSTFEAIDSKHGRFGVLVCEDMWHVAAGYVHFLQGVDAILVPSSSPGRGVTDPRGGLRSARTWNTLIDASALFYQTWMVYVNRVGVEDGITFGGGSRVVDPEGEEVLALPVLEPGSGEARLTSAALDRARLTTPLRRDEKPSIVTQAIMQADFRERHAAFRRQERVP
jgi:predicted amidohydrolase